MYRESANVVIAKLTKAYGVENDQHYTGDMIEGLLSKAIGASDFEYLPHAISFIFPNCDRANNCVMLYEKGPYSVEFNKVELISTEINGHPVRVVNPFTAKRVAVRHGLDETQLLTAFEQFTGINAYGDGQPVGKTSDAHFEFPPKDSPFPTDLSYHRTLTSFYEDDYHIYGEMMFLAFARWRSERCDLVTEVIKRAEEEYVKGLVELVECGYPVEYYDVPLVLRESQRNGTPLSKEKLEFLFGILNDARRRRYANDSPTSVAFTGHLDVLCTKAFSYVPGKSNVIDILEDTDWFGFRNFEGMKDEWHWLTVRDSLRWFIFGPDRGEFPPYAMCSLEQLWNAIVNDYTGSDSQEYTRMREYYNTRCKYLMFDEIYRCYRGQAGEARDCMDRYEKSRAAGVHCIWAFAILRRLLSRESFIGVLVTRFADAACKSGNEEICGIVSKLKKGWKDATVIAECLDDVQDWIWDRLGKYKVKDDDRKCASLLQMICIEAQHDIPDIERDIWLDIEECLAIGNGSAASEQVSETKGRRCLKRLAEMGNPFKGY